MKAPRFSLLALCCAAALAFFACRPETHANDDWPRGTLVIARKDALQRVLTRLQRLDGTPLAKLAAELDATLPDCAWLEGRVESGPPAEVWRRLRCRGLESAFPGLDRERDGREIAFALPEEAGERIVGSIAVSENADVDVEVLLPQSTFSDGVALALPGDEAPGPTLLSARDELVHLRVRPAGGLDIASLVPASSQGDQLFRLKSELFAGTVLDGTWEAVIYLPEEGDAMPPSALAVGFSLKRPAVAAMERFITDIETAWPVRRSAFGFGSADGACLLDLNLLPGLAPCYVATEHALVIGWNPASVRRALAPGGEDDTDAALGATGGIVIELDRIPAADAHFAKLVSAEERRAVDRSYPWRRLTAGGERDGDGVRLRVRLDVGAGA